MGKRFDRGPEAGPSQRQLRAGELIRHALVDVLARGDLRDPTLSAATLTIGEVRMSPDLKHATVFVAALGKDAAPLAAALNKASPFLRGRLGKLIETKFTPDLRFIADTSYDEAARIGAMFANPHIAQDLRGDADED